jgi:precorrin-6A/cobalt-precorrin-6A reductase
MKILILGGTEEARILAEQLVKMGHAVTTSLAGRTSDPLLPAGEVHIGGFGGVQGLADYLKKNGFERLVDVTHPYSVQMASHAAEAAKALGMRCVRLVRPPWVEPQYAFWNHVPSVEAAALALPAGARVLLTMGHRGLESFLARGDCQFVVRTIEPTEKPLPAHARQLIARPPFFEGAESELLKAEAITHLVTKNSGGVQTEAKLLAAQKLRVSVIMIARPALPPAHEVPTIGRAIAALQLSPP